MSDERPPKRYRTDYVTQSSERQLFHSSGPPTLSPMGVDLRYDNYMDMTEVTASNSPLRMVPTVGVNYLPMAAGTTTGARTQASYTPTLGAPMPAMHRHLGPPSSSTLGNPSTHMSPNGHGSMSLFQGASNLYLNQPRITMAHNIQNIYSSDGNEGRRQIFITLQEKLLPRAQFAEYDAQSAAPRNACTENTRKAILNTLQVWARDKATTKVYWLNGMAGTGKTTIAYSFSKFLHEEGALGGTFFASHLRVDTSDVHCIIPTISLQLARYLPSLSHLILDVVESNSDCASWRIGNQFLNFIVKPLVTAYRNASDMVIVPVIVLDALDECSNQSLVTELLSVILNHSKSLPVKFFITSRPEIMLKETFDHPWGHSNFILHEVEKEIVKADIELYIKAYLLGGQTRHNWPPQAELEILVNKSGALFIYAATVCKYITQRGSLSMAQRLSDVVNFSSETASGVTQPLYVLYERILDAAYEWTTPRERSNIRMVLKAVVYVYNPLSMTAISGLVQLSVEEVEAALSPLHSVIHIPSSQYPVQYISIFHASFYDFISNQDLSSKHHLDACSSHEHLALQCLLLIKKAWSQKETISYLAERKCEEISESLAYACGSWAFHFIYADNSNGAVLKEFFEQHLLQWMDCLSILGKLEIAVHSLSKLKNWTNSQRLLTIKVIDAEQFLKENFDFIKHNSLEGYPSALEWLPENSDIWKTYGGRMDCSWKLYFGRRKAWNLSEGVLTHLKPVKSISLSYDSKHIVSASSDCTVRIWNMATAECEAVLKGHSRIVNSAIFSPDGLHIVSASDDYTVRIWDIATGECNAVLKGHSYCMNSAVFSPDGLHIVTTFWDRTARIWNMSTGDCEAKLEGHSASVACAAFSPNGIYIVSGSRDNTVRIWNKATAECEAVLEGHSNAINSVVFSPNGMYIVSASSDHTARIWNTATGYCEAELKGHSKNVTSATFSPDGLHIVTASSDHTAQIWNTITGDCEAELKGHSDVVNSAVFSPNGMYIVSASSDHTTRIWNTATGYCEAELKGHLKKVTSATFSPNGIYVVSGSDDNTARIWKMAEAMLEGHLKPDHFDISFSNGTHTIVPASEDFTTQKWGTATEDCEALLKRHSGQVNSVVFSSDGSHIMSASDDKTARIWNIATGECNAVLKGHPEGVIFAVVSSDGLYILSISSKVAQVWDITAGECKTLLQIPSYPFIYAAFSPDGLHIVSRSYYRFSIWNTATGEHIATLKGHSKSLRYVAFSPDSMYIVSASDDHTARIWNITTRECEIILSGHLKPVKSVAFSPDGKSIVSTSGDCSIRIWNTATGECRAVLKGHSRQVRSAVFSPDGRHIVSASEDYTARVWNIATEECEAVLRRHAPFICNGSDGEIHFSFQPSASDMYEGTFFHTKSIHEIWIPPLFRNPQCISHHLSRICLGYASGEILVLEFKD